MDRQHRERRLCSWRSRDARCWERLQLRAAAIVGHGVGTPPNPKQWVRATSMVLPEKGHFSCFEAYSIFFKVGIRRGSFSQVAFRVKLKAF